MERLYICKTKIHSGNVDVEDDLFKFTLAHFKSGRRSPSDFIPQKHRGFDKQSGTRRSIYYAKPLHTRYLSYLIREEKEMQKLSMQQYRKEELQLAAV